MEFRLDASEVLALADALDQAADAVGEALGTAVQKTAHDIEATAKAAAPVDTGALRNSISTEVTGGTGDVTAVVGPTVEYGGYVELGTSRMGPQPYLAPAFDQHLPALEQALGQAAAEVL